MNNKASIYFLLAVMCALLYVYNILFPGKISPLLDLAFIVITLSGLYVVYSKSALKKSKLRAGVIGGVLLLLVSVLFNIQHWPYADIILFTGLGIIVLLYTWHFWSKPAKDLLDYLKIAWVVLRVAGIVMVFTNIAYGSIVINVSDLLLLGLIFLFIYRDHDSEITAKKREV